MQSLKILLILTFVTCAVSGCGQRGPLYLPEKETPGVDALKEPDSEQDGASEKDGEGSAKNP